MSDATLKPSPRQRLARLVTPLWETPLRRDLTLMVAAFALLRFYAVTGLGTTTFPDTNSYRTLDFLGAAPRLWTVPLVYKIISADGARVAFQLLLGIGCWSTLAIVVAGIPRSPALARIGAGAVLILGLTIQVTQWDMTLLSESISNSLTILTIAGILLVARRQTTAAFALLLTALLLWTFARQVNTIILLLTLPFALVVAFRQLRRRSALILTYFLVVITAWGIYDTSRDTGIWYLNSYGIYAERYVGDPNAEKYFTDHHIPLTDQIRADHAKYQGGNSPGYKNPAVYKAFKDHWRPAYVQYLITHPFSTLRKPLNDASTLLAVNVPYGRPRAVLPDPVQNSAFGVSGGDFPFLFLAVVALWIAARTRRKEMSASDWAGAAIVAIGLVWYLVVWHLSADELVRLEVPVALTLRLGLLVLALTATDRLLAARRNP